MRLSTRSLPLWTGRGTYSHTASTSALAGTTRAANPVGCGLVKRTRGVPPAGPAGRGLGCPPAPPGRAHRLAGLPVAVRPHHEVDVGGPPEQPLAEPLGHAADDAEHRPGPLVALQLADPAEHPLLGVVPDSARVH